MVADSEQPWTTSRCYRLLRPLSSKLAKLRKESEQSKYTESGPRNVSSAFAVKGCPNKTTNFTRPAHKPRGFEKARDPDWQPNAEPGPVKRTYGGRGARKTLQQQPVSESRNVARPGEIALTPFIARMGGQLQCSPLLQSTPSRKAGKSRGPLLASIDDCLAKSTPGDLQKLILGLSEAYANLLQATASGNEKRWAGTRSLASACLRSIPAYIELEEHFAEQDKLDDDADENRDVANKIYEHLEAQFEQRAGQGWRLLKQVVRAHGTALLCTAVIDGVLDSGSISVLVTHCLNVTAWDEAEKLILAYVPRIEALPMPTSTRADLFDPVKNVHMSLVKTSVERTGRHRILYDLLEHMVATELLPLEWLATECFRPIWDRLIRSITEDNSRTIVQATQFLETVTIASIGAPDDRLSVDESSKPIIRRFMPSSREELRQSLDTTFLSLSTVLCSIALVNNSRDDAAGTEVVQRVVWMLDATMIAILRRGDIASELNMLEADREDTQVFARRATWIGFACVVLGLESCRNSAMVMLDTTALLRAINWLAAQYSASHVNFASVLGSLPQLITSIARGTGRIWQDDGFDQMQRIVMALRELSGCRLPHQLWTMKRLALESAREFAHNTGKTKYASYVREIENSMRLQGRLVINHSPEKNETLSKNESPSKNGGFCWEEGIGEWVACTPFVRQEVKWSFQTPIPARHLLLSSIHSENDRPEVSASDCLLEDDDHGLLSDIAESDLENDDHEPAHSSPIKKTPRVSISILGKRTRASSPMVMIPAKRLQRKSSASSVIQFYSDLPEDMDSQSVTEPYRRSRRDIQVLTSRLRTQRSRTSLASGLRSIKRPSYIEIVSDDSDDETDSSSEDDTHRSFITPDSSCRSSPQVPRHSSDCERARTISAEHLRADELDELRKTPARPRFRRKRAVATRRLRAKKRRNWWTAVQESAGEGGEVSEDELIFQ